MRHCGTMRLNTPRLTLRPLTAADADAMYANWASDPAVTRFLRWEPHRDALETFTLLAGWECLYQNPDYYQWGVVENAGGQLIGSISVFPAAGVRPEDFAAPLSAPLWEAGYCFGQRWWGRGYASEALDAVCRFWFGPVQGEALIAGHMPDNPASGRVMEHCGFVFDHEGTDRKFSGETVPCRFYRRTAPYNKG